MLGIHIGLTGIGRPMAHRRQMVPVRVVWIARDADRPGTIRAGVEFTASQGAQRDAA